MILAIYGTGGGGKETIHMVEEIQKYERKWEKIIFIDDTKETGKFKGYECYPYDVFKKKFPYQKVKIHTAIGELQSKRKVIEKIKLDGYHLESIIHPHAVIDDSALLGNGVQVKMGAYIGRNCVIGEGSWVQAYASVQDNATVGNWCQVSAKCSIGEAAAIEDNVFIGMHAVIMPKIKLRKFCIISMGAVVYSDIDTECVCMGNPGRIVSTNKNHRVF